MLVPAARSIGEGLLPIGLTHGARLTRPLPAGQIITADAVELHLDDGLLQLREETIRGSRAAEGSRL
jgi:predicted homoserine dehydrogenase-like protein